MQIRLSRILREAIQESELVKTQFMGRSYMLDHAMVHILKANNSHVSTILSRLLQDWELLQARMKIERELSLDTANHFDISNVVIEKLRTELYGKTTVVNSAHLLRAMLGHLSFATTRVLSQYGVDISSIDKWIGDLPQDENYYDEMHFLLQGYDNMPQSRALQRSFSAPMRTRPKMSESPPQKSKTPTLDKFCMDLTAMACDGKIDPVIGRNSEIERLVQILGRKKKNNPVLIGEAGVGKSAMVEGLAMRIVEGLVPKVLLGKRIYSLDLTSMVAGTKFRGDFEQRVKTIIDEVKDNKNIILFIDELHTIVGAGSSQGSMDTANILKPSLARGELQCIGATTFDEYRQAIESDAALERRFQKVVVEPTTTAQTLEILRRLAVNYQLYHNVVYSDKALEACVYYSDRYLSDRVLPDKAIDLMDEAGSRVSMMSDITTIEPEHIADVVSLSTGIPLSKLSKSEHKRLREIEMSLQQVVLGQQSAVAKVSRAIQRSRTGLTDPNRPIGVFMFVGPTGVGKTLLAKELSNILYDSSESMVRIDMSEYSEKHNVSRLIGSPPGYVGYGEGGQLTERVRRQPYSIVLLDEIEKAHPDICNIMLQVFDDGHLTDGLGRKVDFRNTVIIMTSNVGSSDVAAKRTPLGFSAQDDNSRVQMSRDSVFRKALEKNFAPEFINRIDDIVVFNTLTDSKFGEIIELELAKLAKRICGLGYGISISDHAKRQLVEKGYSTQYGARSLKRTILEHLEEPLAELIIDGKLQVGDTVNVECIDSRIELEVA
ncbi:MAG: ATP-dependent Clp protease ATP-binding subunit [Rikenellaceae bacterium]